MVYNGITKGQAFKVLLTAYASGDNQCPFNNTYITNAYIRISRDGGALEVPTNNGVFLV